MNYARSRIPYPALVDRADRLLEDCEDDVECLAIRLGGLDPEVRDDLLTSDLLNAWQVFYYCFRLDPGAFLRERLELEPASALPGFLKIREIDLFDIFFGMRENIPWIVVTDGEKTVASFTGRRAYEEGVRYCANPEHPE